MSEISEESVKEIIGNLLNSPQEGESEIRVMQQADECATRDQSTGTGTGN